YLNRVLRRIGPQDLPGDLAGRVFVDGENDQRHREHGEKQIAESLDEELQHCLSAPDCRRLIRRGTWTGGATPVPGGPGLLTLGRFPAIELANTYSAGGS